MNPRRVWSNRQSIYASPALALPHMWRTPDTFPVQDIQWWKRVQRWVWDCWKWGAYHVRAQRVNLTTSLAIFCHKDLPFYSQVFHMCTTLRRTYCPWARYETALHITGLTCRPSYGETIHSPSRSKPCPVVHNARLDHILLSRGRKCISGTSQAGVSHRTCGS